MPREAPSHIKAAHPALRRATAMGVATFIGSVAPSLPFLVLGKGAGDIGAVIVTFALLGIIAEVRHRSRTAGLATVSVFGGFDGLTSEVAVLAGQLVHHQPVRTILSVGGGLAAGSAVSMALGEWLGDRFGVKRWHAYLQTVLTAVVAIVAGVAVSLLLGGVG